MKTGWWARLVHRPSRWAWWLLLAGLLLRWTVRDRYPILDILYYATPWPLVAVASFLCWLVSHRRLARLFLSLVASLACLFYLFERTPAPATHSETHTFLLWNIMGQHPRERIKHAVHAHDADITLLVETAWVGKYGKAQWRNMFPHHHIQFMPGGMILLTREPVRDVQRHRPIVPTNYYSASLQLDGKDLHLLAVDLASNPKIFRRDYIRQSLAFASKQREKGPTLYLGDFNTPFKSVWLDEVRTEFTDVFEEVGDGYRPTWPNTIPLLQLDHIFASRDIKLLRCRHLNGSPSDHRKVWLEFRLP